MPSLLLLAPTSLCHASPSEGLGLGTGHSVRGPRSAGLGTGHSARGPRARVAIPPAPSAWPPPAATSAGPRDRRSRPPYPAPSRPPLRTPARSRSGSAAPGPPGPGPRPCSAPPIAPPLPLRLEVPLAPRGPLRGLPSASLAPAALCCPGTSAWPRPGGRAPRDTSARPRRAGGSTRGSVRSPACSGGFRPNAARCRGEVVRMHGDSGGAWG
jgi:hypothetical protein